MTRVRSLLLAALVALATLVTVAAPATAHEHVITEDCRFELSVGWKTEPPFAGEKNGLDLRVERITNTPADPAECHAEEGEHAHGADGFTATKELVTTGVLGNVTVTYTIAGKTFPSTPAEKEAFDFRAQFGKPGYYTGEILPTREGKYTIRIVGKIDGVDVDVSVIPHELLPPASVMFPAKDLTGEEATGKIAKLESDLAALRSEVAAMKADAQGSPTNVEEKTNGTPAPGALLVALAAVGVALVARRRA